MGLGMTPKAIQRGQQHPWASYASEDICFRLAVKWICAPTENTPCHSIIQSRKTIQSSCNYSTSQIPRYFFKKITENQALTYLSYVCDLIYKGTEHPRLCIISISWRNKKFWDLHPFIEIRPFPNNPAFPYVYWCIIKKKKEKRKNKEEVCSCLLSGLWWMPPLYFCHEHFPSSTQITELSWFGSSCSRAAVCSSLQTGCVPQWLAASPFLTILWVSTSKPGAEGDGDPQDLP